MLKTIKNKNNISLPAGVLKGLWRAKVGRFGFTLMEVMVAMSIFVIVALASLTIYAAILRASQRTTAYTRIQQEAQLIMEVLAKKIRTSRVNYEYYGHVPGGPVTPVIDENGVATLALTDLSNNNYLFSVAGDSLTIQTKAAGENIYGTAIPLPSELVKINSLVFFIQPLAFPFDINLAPATQPRVTMVITFSATKGTQSASFTVQQTVPQRSGGIVE